MRENLELTHEALSSQAVLTALVEAESAVRERLDSTALDELFDYGRFLRNLPEVFERLDTMGEG